MNQDKLNERLSEEIKSFRKVWDGGYFEGDVLDPVGYSTFGPLGYISVLHALYLMSIKPYVNNESLVLEIGPGRGAFTKAIAELEPKEIWCLDAKPASENHFFEYVGKRNNIHYIQVSDFLCSELPDNHFNYFFSFGALCHVSFDGITKYLTNLYPKLKSGAECFIMVADYDKYNSCMNNIDKLTVFKYLPFQKLIKLNWKMYKIKNKRALSYRRNYPEILDPDPGKWYHAGIEQTCELLTNIGYSMISKDLGLIQRDPIIHFQKK